MLGCVKVLGCVFADRGVTAADVAALPAETKVNPGLADLQALFATARMRLYRLNGIEMTALGAHA
jgi:hypothetical protein